MFVATLLLFNTEGNSHVSLILSCFLLVQLSTGGKQPTWFFIALLGGINAPDNDDAPGSSEDDGILFFSDISNFWILDESSNTLSFVGSDVEGPFSRFSLFCVFPDDDAAVEAACGISSMDVAVGRLDARPRPPMWAVAEGAVWCRCRPPRPSCSDSSRSNGFSPQQRSCMRASLN